MYRRALETLILGNLVILAGLVCASEIRLERLAVLPANQMKIDEAVTADGKYSGIGLMYMVSSGQRVVDYGMLEEPDTLGRGEKGRTGQPVTTGGTSLRGNAVPGEGPSVGESSAMGEGPTVGEGAVPGEGVFLEESFAPNWEDPDASGPEETPAYELDEEEYDILLRIVEAEAGSEDEDGRLLVANVVFNRVNSEDFPDTVSEVVLQQSKGVTQFSPVASGSIWKVTVSEKTVSAVGRALEGEDISQGALYFAARKHADSKSMRWFDEKLTFLFQHGGHEFFR